MNPTSPMVVDTSAVMAVALGEGTASRCASVMAEAEALVMCAATSTELWIVAERRGVLDLAQRLVAELAVEISALTATRARSAAAAFGVYGKGRHPAGLNFGDCFAYALAMERGWPLLFVGEDFGRTDVRLVESAGGA